MKWKRRTPETPETPKMHRRTLCLLLLGFATCLQAARVHAGDGGVLTPRQPAEETCTFKPVFRADEHLVYKYSNIIDHLPDEAGTPAPKAAEKPAPDEELQPDPAAIRSYAMSMTLRLSVLGVDEHGAASFAVLPDDIEIDVAGEAIAANAGFTRKQAEAPSPIPEKAGFLPKLALALARAALRVDVRADGTISDVAGLEDVYKLVEAEGREGARVIGPLAPQSIQRTLATLFRIDQPGPDGSFPARKAGDTWSLVDRASQSRGLDIVGTTTFKLDSCSPGLAAVSGSAAMTVEPTPGEPGKEPPKPDPTQGVPTIEEQSDLLAIAWDPLMKVSAKIGDARLNPLRFRTRSRLELVEAPK
jgi:hypothetical protein